MLLAPTESGRLPTEPLPNPPDGPLLVVCHDAGAANLIFSWLRAWLRDGSLQASTLKLAISGPAATLWSSGQSYGVKNLPLAAHGLADSACLLSGTGWQTDWEHRARMLARERGLPSIGVIDHWVNYPQRFEHDGEVCLPDALWVSDDYALRLAKASFPGIPVQVLPNLYLQTLLSQIAPLQQGQGDVLYVLEPARNQWGRAEEGEFQGLDFFLRHRRAAGITPGTSIRLRLHPSDPAGKYDSWIHRHADAGVRLDDAKTLAESIGRAGIVAGLQTAAMVLALAAGRKVISTLPPWAGPCALPHENIHMLRDLSGTLT